MIKKIEIILNFFFKIFKLKIFLAASKKKQDLELVDKNSWFPFLNQKTYFEEYKKSLILTKQIKTDNFSKKLRMYSLGQLVNYALKKNNKSDFAECGCWKGTSAHFISTILKKENFTGNFFIFDSFEGLSEFRDEDYLKNESFYNLKNKNEKNVRKFFSSTEDEVIGNLSEFNFIDIQKGWIPEKFKNVSGKKFSFVHVDVDLYEPTLECLKFFYTRLEKNGVIVCDDYNSSTYPGAKKAWDEFFKDKKKDLLFSYEVPMGSAFIIK